MKPLFLFLFLIGSTSISVAQTNTFPWPPNPRVGIGTQSSVGGPKTALHIHYKPTDLNTDTAIIRLSEGDTTYGDVYGILGLMPYPLDTTYTSLSRGTDLVLHEHSGGDLILTNFNPGTETHPSGAIRLATTPNGSDLPMPIAHRDIERVTVLHNGNVGIDLPQNIMTNAGNPVEQLQIGGGNTPMPGDSSAVPGLFIYGGNPYEGMLLNLGGTAPIDWRYIAFNRYVSHMVGSVNRVHRVAPMSSSRIAFAPDAGGTLSLEAYPYSGGLDTFPHGFYVSVTGKHGLEIWSDETGDQYHHLFDIWRPGDSAWITGGLRNVNGLCMHHTPVYIGPGDSLTTWQVPNFTDLANVHPNLGDGKTWMLAVNGPALFKEVLILDSVWSDFVFDPTYRLRPLDEVSAYITANRHLPDVPTASEVKANGISVAETEATNLQKIEELTLYVIQLNKRIEKQDARIEALERENQDLKKGMK